MEYSLNAGTSVKYRRLVPDVALNEFKRGMSCVLIEI
jgi:hypothetical protein